MHDNSDIDLEYEPRILRKILKPNRTPPDIFIDAKAGCFITLSVPFARKADNINENTYFTPQRFAFQN